MFNSKLMKKIALKSFGTTIALILVLSVFSSCADEDYVNAIPGNCTALVSVDASALLDGKTDGFINDFFNTDDVSDCGIDWSSKLYLFETVEGNIGLAAKVDDDGKLNEWLGKLSNDGYCKAVSEYNGYKFTVVKDSWVTGFSSGALVVLGPTLPSQNAEVKRQIVNLLEQGEDTGVKDTRMFAKLDSIMAPVAVVAQANALPDKFAAMFSVGAPKDADVSQVMISAGIENSDDCFVVYGETFSFNKALDAQLKDSRKIFRPITETYTGNVPDTAAMGVFMNVDGRQLINVLHSNKTFQALLAGVNTAIDMDNIIKSIDGDVAFVLPEYAKKHTYIQMCAKLRSKDFLEDIDYWKKSCPVGSKIVNWDVDAYSYVNDGMSYFFGVTKDLQFYSGSTESYARNILSKAADPLSAEIQSLIKGNRLALFINVNSFVSHDGIGKLIKSFIGGKETVLYIME